MSDDPGTATRDKLIDLYTRHGDQLTPAQAAEWGVSATDHAASMMDMPDERHRSRLVAADDGRAHGRARRPTRRPHTSASDSVLAS